MGSSLNYVYLMTYIAALAERLQNWVPVSVVWAFTTLTILRTMLSLLALMSGFFLTPYFLAGPDNSGAVVLAYWIVSSPLIFFYSKKLNRQIHS